MISSNFRAFYILHAFWFPLVWPWCIYVSHNARIGPLWN